MNARAAVAGAVLCALALACAAAASVAPPPFAADYRLPPGPLEFTARERVRCLECHGMPGLLVRDSLRGDARLLTVPPAAFAASVHGTLDCTQCHDDVRRYPHARGTPAAPRRVRCADDCHAPGTAETRARHAAVAAEYARSRHAAGEHAADSTHAAPACAYCHGGGDPHAVRPVRERASRAGLLAQCEPCHADGERMAARGVEPGAVPSYRRSFHARALALGSARAAVCVDCHTAHGVRAPSDTASTVHARRLSATCGRDGCHRGVQLRFAMSGANHLGLRVARDPVLARVKAFFGGFGLLVVLVFGAGVLADAQRRTWRHAPPAPRPDDAELVPRVPAFARLQHGALVLAFVLLALSGLPLHLADRAEFRALGFALGGLGMLHALHRAAGVLLLATALVHAAWLAARLVHARGDVRAAWPLLPGARDLREAAALVLWQLRLRPEPPAFDRHEFRQKAHYFAVLAGTPVMATTGVLLWFPVFFGNRLPDSAFGVAYLVHSKEAMLALFVALVWHLYHVVVVPGARFRPLVLLDGRITRAQWREQHPAEAARASDAVPAASDDDPWRLPARVLLPLVLLAAALLRVREALRTPLWFDELFTLWMARHPLPESLALLPGDIHPPLPTLLVSLWLAVGGESPLWLKTLPLAFGLLTVAVTYGFARALFGRRTALLAAALLALHPSHVYFSQELRGYGLLTLVLLLAAWSAWRWVERGRLRHAAGWIAAAALALYTHYLAAVVIALLGAGALVAVRRNAARVRAWLAIHALLALAVAPLLWLLPAQLSLSRHTWVAHPAFADLADLARKLAFGAVYLVPPLGLLAAFALRGGGDPRRARAARFVAGMALGAIATTYAVSLRGPHLFASRYMYFTLPYWCVLFAAGLDVLPWPRLKPVLAGALLVLAGRSTMLRPPLAEAADLQRAIAAVRAQLKPGDQLFAADPHSLLVCDQAPDLPRGRLLTAEPRLEYYRGGALFGAGRLLAPDSLAATAARARWWAVYVPEPGRPGAAAAAQLDSLAHGARRRLGIVTLWASDPAMLAEEKAPGAPRPAGITGR
ncbi:MAG: glycosyltransferase family 39 protein [Candidatus Eisenbacteria bacterium]